MNSGGHVGTGILFYTIASQLLNHPVTPAGLLTAAIISLLPDIDVVLSYTFNIKHREITHHPLFIALSTAVTAVFSAPLSTALLSHYLTDYVYPDTLRKIVPVTPGNTVTEGEFYSAALLGFSLVYTITLLVLRNSWFTTASAAALIFITLTGLYEIKKG